MVPPNADSEQIMTYFTPAFRHPHPKGLDIIVQSIPDDTVIQLLNDFYGILAGEYGYETEQEQFAGYRAAILCALSAGAERLRLPPDA
jgi:hypothetical protein